MLKNTRKVTESDIVSCNVRLVLDYYWRTNPEWFEIKDHRFVIKEDAPEDALLHGHRILHLLLPLGLALLDPVLQEHRSRQPI